MTNEYTFAEGSDWVEHRNVGLASQKLEKKNLATILTTKCETMVSFFSKPNYGKKIGSFYLAKIMACQCFHSQPIRPGVPPLLSRKTEGEKRAGIGSGEIGPGLPEAQTYMHHVPRSFLHK